MRVILCCGAREWDDEALIFDTLLKEHKKNPIDYVIEGGQESHRTVCGPDESWVYGADYQCKKMAQSLAIQVIECPANWDTFKKAAGPIRNSNQLKIAMELACEGGQISGSEQKMNLLVLAFHSDIKKSKGTKDMVKRAEKAGVKVRIIK
jgi:hypothetical protein